MVSHGKPKRVKLWKNSVTNEKKQKLSKKEKAKNRSSTETPGTLVTTEENILIKKEKGIKLKNKIKQEIKKENQTEEKLIKTEKKSLKRKNEQDTFNPNKKQKISEKEKQIESGQSNSGKNSLKKKRKPDNLTRKEWKMLHLDKASKSPKEFTGENESKNATESKLPLTKKARKELKMKGKGKKEIFEIGQTLKSCWEELRRQDCEPARKSQLLKQVCGLLKGRVKEFTFAHDTVRVLECVFGLGADTHRALLLDELKDEFIPLAKSKYGKFLLMKVLRHGSKNQKDTIIKAFHGKIIKLIRHSQAAEVVELAFNECANNSQRFEMIQEFFGPNYKFFKVTDVHSLDQLIEANPDKKIKDY